MKTAHEKVMAMTRLQRIAFARLREGMTTDGQANYTLVMKGLAIRTEDGRVVPDPNVLAVFNNIHGVVRKIKAPSSWPFPGGPHVPLKG